MGRFTFPILTMPFVPIKRDNGPRSQTLNIILNYGASGPPLFEKIMKAKELMIGDWVNRRVGWRNEESGEVEYETEGMFPIEVTCIYDDIVQYDEEYDEEIVNTVEAADYELFPIPLTREILEKNGFENISNHTLKGYDTFRLDIEQRGYDYCVTIKLKDYYKLQSYDDRWYTLCEMEFGCGYVHELQHALRLCGIDKEIEL